VVGNVRLTLADGQAQDRRARRCGVAAQLLHPGAAAGAA
jgi:hypothetical protein